MTPKEFGIKARQNSKPCKPYKDSIFVKEFSMQDTNPGALSMLLDEWVEGWKEENERQMNGAVKTNAD